jgi:hypothetical protein
VVATNDWAAAQPTATGRALADLQVHDGRIFAGYGDYGANTGPIVISSLDPAAGTGFAMETTADTEAVYNFREVNGQLVAPSIDPRVSADYTIDGPWENVSALGATHVYDTVTLTGTDLWMVGSQGADAVAWRSADGGTTWEEARRVAPRSSTDYARFYFAGVAGGQLYVQAADLYNGAHPTSTVFDGSTWADGPSLLPAGGWGWRPVSYGSGFLMHEKGHGMDSNIRYFDGQSTQSVAYGLDFEVAADGVYVLGTDGVVKRSTDLVTWTAVAAGPSDARSIAVTGSAVYVGTASSQLWAYGMATTESGPTTKEPVTEEPVAEEPVAEEPVTEEPVTEEPVAEEPVADEPEATEPTRTTGRPDHVTDRGARGKGKSLR